MNFDNLKKIYIITFCTHFHFYIHVYALLLINRGLTLVQVSGIESAVIAFVFLLEVPTGMLADRIGRKWSVAGSLFCLMWAEFLFLFSRSYPAYLFVAFLTGVGFAFASGATEALVYDSLPHDDRESRMKKAMSQIGISRQIAVFLSPLVGGLIVSDLAQGQFNLAIVLTVLTLLAGFSVSLTLNEPTADWDTNRSSMVLIFKSGFNELRSNRRLQRLAFLVILTTPFTGMMVTTLVPPYLRQWSLSPFMIGLALSLGNLLAVVTLRLVVSIERSLGRRWGLLVLTLMPGVGYLLLAGARAPWLAWGMVCWMYGTNEMRKPLVSAYQNEWIAAPSRATVLSLINMLLSLFTALMMPVYAGLASRSLLLAFVVMGGVILVAGLTLGRSIHQHIDGFERVY